MAVSLPLAVASSGAAERHTGENAIAASTPAKKFVHIPEPVILRCSIIYAPFFSHRNFSGDTEVVR